MADVTLVQNDTRPDLNATLTNRETGAPLDLTNASSIRLQMRKADDRRYTVNAVAVFVDRVNGRVRYSWAANDLSVTGEYLVQWEIHWSDGTEQTVPTPPSTLEVRRQ